MFLHTVSAFGPHQKHTIHHPVSKTTFSIVPACGGFLSELLVFYKDKMVNVIEGCNTYEEWQEDVYFKSTWLLPFPNRLKDGNYSFEGKNYQFPITDTNCHNALHGFVFDKTMKLQKVELTPSYAQVSLEYVYNGELAYYPFPFHLQIGYTLMDKQLIVDTKITNSGNTKIPIGIGFHPYFQFPSKVDALQLQLPKCQKIEVEGKMIPTGKKMNYTHFEEKTTIGNLSLDTAFKANPTDSNSYKIHLTDPQNGLQLTYFQDTIFPYFQVFTPSHRNSIAIEPMSCNVDAFNNGEGLTILERGETWAGSFGVEVS
ncbi:MAG: hypothetical protein R3E32_19570 [Chitinophagales bacterium]